MKHLNKKSSAVLQKLIDCMSDPTYAKTMGSFAKIEKADSCFMPVSIEKLHHIPTFENHNYCVKSALMPNGNKSARKYPLIRLSGIQTKGVPMVVARMLQR